MSKPINVLVEGPDCAGKSTLVKELHNRLGLDAAFCGHRSGDQFRRYAKLYGSADGMVFERGHISEAVYSKLFGREQMPGDDLQLLDQLVSRDFVVVVCLPERELMLSRYRERGTAVYQQVEEDTLSIALNWFSGYFDDRSFRHQLLYRSADWDELEQAVQAVGALLDRKQ